jgi:hypothetical protein
MLGGNHHYLRITRETTLLAQEHLNGSASQWEAILWSDETWVSPGRHIRMRVTLYRDGAFHEVCIFGQRPCKIGWIFWGLFHGTTKGPILLWEKEWAAIILKARSNIQCLL